MPARLLGVFAAAAGLAADVVLPGEAAGAHRPHFLQSGFELVYPFLEFSAGGAAKALRSAGVQLTYFESNGTAHEWQTWRRDLNDFAPRLFR